MGFNSVYKALQEVFPQIHGEFGFCNDRCLRFRCYTSLIGKFGAVFASIPFPIYATVYCVLFGLVGVVGLSFLQFTNMNSMRNLIIIGLSLFLGISIPQYFNEYATLHHGLVRTNAGWAFKMFDEMSQRDQNICSLSYIDEIEDGH